MADLISRAAAIEAVYYKPSHKMAIEVLKEVPTIDAIPVGWLREKIKEHTDEEGWQDYLANSFGLCIEEWQKEQEAR